MTTEPQPSFFTEEPIREAAQLLRRIAFFLLFGAAPAFSPYSKRSLLLFGTIGAALLVIAAIIEGRIFSEKRAPLHLPMIIILVAGFIYLFWSGLSLAWTPFPGESGGRYANFIGIILATALVLFVLPQRIGASRLYILSGAVAIGWIMCLGLSFAPDSEIDHTIIDRSLVTLALLTPPVSVWLIYRRRDSLAIILVLAACVAAFLLRNNAVFVGMLLSVGVFSASLLRPDRTRYYLALLSGLLIFLAPLIPLLFYYLAQWIFGDESFVSQILHDWFRIVADEPFRLLTGHGFDTMMRAATAGFIPLESPHGLLIDTWFELGIIGAASLAVLLIAFVMMSSTMTRPSAAAMQAVIAGAFVIGTFGGNASQPSWLASLGLAAIAILALDRGQYKTARPGSRDLAMLHQNSARFSILSDRFRF